MTSREWIEAPHTDTDVAVLELDHPFWERAGVVELNRYWSGDAAPTERHAQARLIWTDTALLARFSCNQYEPLIVSSSPKTYEKTIKLWDRDVCEVFLLPAPGHPELYFEFEAAPTGEWLDLALTTTAKGRQTDWEFSSGMQTASRITANNIVVAVRIPWTGPLVRPVIGDEWRVNLCRCIGPAENRGYLAWQPTFTEVPNFHVTGVFGRLLFR